jgi:hypothetical protein
VQFRLRTMFLLFVVLWSAMAAFGLWGAAVFAAQTLAAVCLSHFGHVFWRWMFWLLLLAVAIVLMLPAPIDRNRVRRHICKGHLQRIGQALLQYKAEYHRLPPACTVDKNGRMMHSWRVLILPYLGYKDLYEQYEFNEPWDGPKNKKLMVSCPCVYFCPYDKYAYVSRGVFTSYAAIIGSGTVWSDEEINRADEKAANTILLVEVAGQNVAWTEPRDAILASSRPASSSAATISIHHVLDPEYFHRVPTAGANVLLANGSVRLLTKDMLTPDAIPDLFKVGGFREEYLATKNGRRFDWANCIALAVWLGSTGLLMLTAVRSRRKGKVECGE